MIGSGREKGGTSANGKQSWRELAGAGCGRINSPQARKRRQQKWLKLLGALVFLVAIISGLAWAVIAVKNSEEKIQITPTSKPIERILFTTDGVLPDAWLSSVVDLRPGMSMMEADIFALKKGIESEGQVASASVERVFPSDLRIQVKERNPVLRLVSVGADGRKIQSIVARDGTIYQGIGYPSATLQNLPYLQPYQKADGHFLPMVGVARVGDSTNISGRPKGRH